MTRRMSIALALAAIAPLAQANDPLSYSFWDVQYLNSKVTLDDGVTEETDKVEGMRAQISVGLARFLNFTGEWDQRRYSKDGANDRDAFVSVGFGSHTQHPDWQIFGSVTYERYDVDYGSDVIAPLRDVSNEGYGAQLGVRARLPNLELHASYRYLDLSDGDSTDLTGGRYGGGLALQLSPWWALVGDYTVRTLEYEQSDGTGSNDAEFKEWSVGFRRYFATDTDRRARKDGVLTDWGGDEAE